MEIGGYFGLDYKNNLPSKLAKGGIALKSGRSALKLILKETQPQNIYLPFYCCDALLAPIKEQKIPFLFYEINTNLEIKTLPVLKKGELIIYIDYWGLKSKYSKILASIYKEQFILDNTHQINHRAIQGSWSFNSLRKFYGLADGSILYAPQEGFNYKYLPTIRNSHLIYQHLIERIEYGSSAGYAFFQKNEELLGEGMELMSKLSAALSTHIDIKAIKKQRRNNFDFLHNQLKETNYLTSLLEHKGRKTISFSYPYWSIYNNLTQEMLWEEGVFVPILWKDCLQREKGENFLWEEDLCKNVLHLAIDHRYDQKIMKTLVKKLKVL